jgi:hypothetical protein
MRTGPVNYRSHLEPKFSICASPPFSEVLNQSPVSRGHRQLTGIVIPLTLKGGEGHELANPALEPGGGGRCKPERYAGGAVPGYRGLARAGGHRRKIREGIDAPRNGGEHPPCHVDSLRHSLKQTAVAQFDEVFTRCRARWIKAGFIKRRRTSIMEATKIPVDGDYKDPAG